MNFHSRPRSRAAVAIVTLLVAIAAGVVLTQGSEGSGADQLVARNPCGAAAPALYARALGSVGRKIYEGEVSSPHVWVDRRQVETDPGLLRDLAGGNRASVAADVSRLVYSHTHIVRLRVSRGGGLISDVGGPYILAPISGSLRYHGKAVGHYVFSVQDDLGYVKLEKRFIDVPVALHVDGRSVPIEGVTRGGPALIPTTGPTSSGGNSYEAFSFNAKAFPTGLVRISLLTRLPAALALRSCTEVKAFAETHVAQRIAARFVLSPSTYRGYMLFAERFLPSRVFVSPAREPLIGIHGAPPTRLPTAGWITYRKRAYYVSSFAENTSAGRGRIYVLTAR